MSNSAQNQNNKQILLRSKYLAACREYFPHGVSKGERRISPLVAVCANLLRAGDQ